MIGWHDEEPRRQQPDLEWATGLLLIVSFALELVAVTWLVRWLAA